MFKDLHEGILEEFAERQAYAGQLERNSISDNIPGDMSVRSPYPTDSKEASRARAARWRARFPEKKQLQNALNYLARKARAA
jgi:hypothetical protein